MACQKPRIVAHLEARAGTLALGAYIKGQLFEGHKPRRPAIRSTADPNAMARALALLGQSVSPVISTSSPAQPISEHCRLRLM
jgi:hypothetical protein